MGRGADPTDHVSSTVAPTYAVAVKDRPRQRPVSDWSRSGRTIGCAVLAILAAGASQDPSARQEPPAVRWEGTLDGVGRPVSVAILPSGDLVLVDDASRVVEQRRRDGTLVTRLEPVAGWRRPASVSVRAAGGVLVCDPEGGLVARFDGEGRAIGASPLPDGTPLRPRAAAELDEGVVLIDEVAPAVLAATPEGSVRWIVGDADLPGGWGRPVDLAVAPDGRVFVVDADRHRVVVLSAEGRFLSAFGDRGPFPGLFAEPSGCAIAGGRLFVADRLNHRISVFDLDGTPRGQWGMHAVVPREGEGRIHYPEDVAIDAAGETAVVAEPFERRVQWFGDLGAAGSASTTARLPARDDVLSHFGGGVAVAGDLTALWEPESASIVVFDWRSGLPVHVATFGGPGAAPDRFGRISAIAVASDRPRLAVADPASSRISFVDLDRDPNAPLRYDPFMARLAGTVDLAPLLEAARRLRPDAEGTARRAEPTDLAWTPDGRLLVLDRGAGLLVVLASPPSRGIAAPLPSEVLAAWGPQGDAPGRFAEPVAMALSPSRDAVAVLDAERRTIHLLDLAGRPLREIALPEAPSGPREPGGISWSSDGFVVGDVQGDRLIRLTPQGTVVGEMGATGLDDGLLWAPGGLDRRSDGTVLVVDVGNHRVQGFSEVDGTWRLVFSLGRASTRPRGMPAE